MALALANKFASKTPVLNFLGAELALWAELHGIEAVRTKHVQGHLNKIADWLSRIHQTGIVATFNSLAARPPELAGMKLQKPPQRTAAYYALPVPGLNGEVLGAGSSSGEQDGWSALRRPD